MVHIGGNGATHDHMDPSRVKLHENMGVLSADLSAGAPRRSKRNAKANSDRRSFTDEGKATLIFLREHLGMVSTVLAISLVFNNNQF